jgi:hypothetical protein
MDTHDSTEGRWLSPDPLAGDLSNPQSLNRYAYVLNNPTTLTDPLGLKGCRPGTRSLGDGICVGPQSPGGGLRWPLPWDPFDMMVKIWYDDEGGRHVGINTDAFWLVQWLETHPTEDNANPAANKTLKQKICSAIPSGRTTGASGGVGGVGSPGGGGELVINYDTGQVSAFFFGGFQVGWNGGVSGSVYTGYVWGLNGSNSNYSGGFTGVNGGAGLGGFAESSSGGLTGGTSGLAPNGKVNAAGISFGGGLLGGFSGGVTATNYSKPAQLGKFWGFGLNPADWLLYAARQVCK